MKDALARLLLHLSCACCLMPSVALAGDIGVNLYGLSYHFERGRARDIGVDNEVNPGLGLRYRIPHSERVEWFLDGGAYRDSGRNTAVYAGGGAFWKPTRQFGAGIALAAFESDTYNRGRAFVAPIPIVSYDFGVASLNMAYLPKIADLNDINTLAFWITLWPKKW
jgi:hypothetical protein